MFFRNRHSHGFITQEMSNSDVINLMSEGKPATIMLFKMIIDRYDLFELLSMLYVLDSVGVYSSYICKLFYELCGHDFQKFSQLIHGMEMDHERVLYVKRFLRLIWFRGTLLYKVACHFLFNITFNFALHI